MVQIHLFCVLTQPVIVTSGQPVCKGFFFYWSFGTLQLNQGIILNSEIVTATLTFTLRVNTPFSQVYNDLLHSGF